LKKKKKKKNYSSAYEGSRGRGTTDFN
jgi:hypothetical protein